MVAIFSGLFGKNNHKPQSKGLFASLEELMEQRKNIAYIKAKNNIVSNARSGNIKSAFKGRGIEVEEIRAYSFGDSLRDIDWRVTARKNEPYTKLYAQEKDREIFFLLDLSSSMIFGTKTELKSVTASKIAALLGWVSQENKDRFGGVIFDGSSVLSFVPKQNRGHLLSLLKKISDASKSVLTQKSPQSNIKTPLQTLIKMIKERSSVFIISDFANFGEEEKKILTTLSKKSKIFCINIVDFLESSPPQAGEYMIENGGKKLVFSSKSQSFREDYLEHFAAKKLDIINFCKRFNFQYMEIRTDMPIVDQLKIF